MIKPWLCSRWASVWSNVCYGSWWKITSWRVQDRQGILFSTLLSMAHSLPDATPWSFSRSLGQWGWETGLALCATIVSLFLSPIGFATYLSRRQSKTVSYLQEDNTFHFFFFVYFKRMIILYIHIHRIVYWYLWAQQWKPCSPSCNLLC